MPDITGNESTDARNNYLDGRGNFKFDQQFKEQKRWKPTPGKESNPFGTF